MAEVRHDLDRPVGVLGGQRPRGGDRDQPVALPVDEQHGDREPAQQRGILPAPVQDAEDRAGGREERDLRLGCVLAPVGEELDPGVQHRRVGAGRVGEAEVRRVHDPLPVAALADLADERLSDPRDPVDEEGGRHLAVGVAPARGDGRVEQDEPLDELGVRRREEDRDHPAHRVPDEDGRLADDLPQERGEQRHVGGHGALPLASAGQPEPGEVERIHAAVPPQPRPEQHPVQVRAAEPVDEDQRGMRVVAVAWLGTAELDVVHRGQVGPEVGQVAGATPPGGQGQGRGGRPAGALVGGVRGGHPCCTGSREPSHA